MADISQPESPYWISFDIDSVDAAQFGSTGTAEYAGLSLDFTKAFFQRFIPRSVGMDLTEVNFELAASPQERTLDENTFRDLLEVVVDSVNRPTNRSAILP